MSTGSPAPGERLVKYVDAHNFPEIVGELVRQEPALQGIAYTADYPKQVGQVPAVVWKRLRRVPGAEGVETKSGRLRQTVDNGNGTTTEIWSQWQTCLFEFTCCGRSSVEAEELVVRFERLMDESKGILLALGASELVFDEENNDRILSQTDDVESRCLRYMARLEKLSFRTYSQVQEIRVRVFEPQEETWVALRRGYTDARFGPDGPVDLLPTRFISAVLHVTLSGSPSGIARDDYYVLGVDFVLLQDPVTYETVIRWLGPGRQPAVGAVYLVRFRHWTGFSKLLLPYRSVPAAFETPFTAGELTPLP